MSLEASVAKVLREPEVGLVNFRIDTFAVDQAAMESVAKAIESQDLRVEIGGTGSFGAAYTSWKGRRWDEGEKKQIGRITLGKADVVSTPIGKASIFHESVHALVDVKSLKVTELNDEVAAYVADATYLRATKTTIRGGTLEMAIYKAAFQIVDDKGLLKKKGVAIKWSDCDDLRAAIKAYPNYSQLKDE